MTWGILVTEDGTTYEIDDHEIEGEGSAVRILTAYWHKVMVIPMRMVSKIEEQYPSGREWRLSSDGKKGISPDDH
jgi:hypothetical protein